MKRFISLFVFVLAVTGLALLPQAVRAEEKPYAPVQTVPQDLELHHVGRITEVLKTDLVEIDDDKIYKLANLRVPFQLNDAVLEYLNERLLGQTAGAYISALEPTPRDRSGNIIAHLLLDDGVWLQAEVVVKGMAWVESSKETRDLVRTLYQYESVARENQIGLWANPDLSVKTDANIRKYFGSFQVFEGVPIAYREKGGFAFVNFGTDPLTDFTLIVHPKDMHLFRHAGEKSKARLPGIAHLKIRVRGWLENNSGPMMELTHPEQIDFFDPENTKAGLLP